VYDQDTVKALVVFGSIAAYIVGCFFTGMLVSSDFYSLRAPYGRVYILGLGLLLSALLVHIFDEENYAYYILLGCFGGVQSALGCKIDSTVIRTTYMSGCVTDIGASLGKYLSDREVKSLLPAQMLFPSLVGFIFGGLLAGLVYPVLGRFSAIVSVALFLALGLAHYILQWRILKDGRIWWGLV
jgi:uncharacterized membrane protein YoaK (UPF0700 family)